MRRESPTDLRSGRLLTRIARGEHVVEIPDATKEEIYAFSQTELRKSGPLRGSLKQTAAFL